MTPSEILERLRRLSTDEEIASEGRIALAQACDAALSPDALHMIMSEAYATRAGLATSNHLARVVRDALTELPPHASGAV